ncbi:hypothetical protein HDU78_005754 [Chytriomyces hyalinus]|nr:hypothetical protein HDU78_005754 [Chytriomyces hyalinus]
MESSTVTSKTRMLWLIPTTTSELLTLEVRPYPNLSARSLRTFFAQFQGTALYSSPEIVRKEMYRGPEAEMWALGVLLYTMVVGGSPFHSDAEILEGTVRMPRGFQLESDKDYHRGCRHLIQRLLDCDPETRITIEEVLEHSWLKKEVEFYQTAYQSSHMST